MWMVADVTAGSTNRGDCTWLFLRIVELVVIMRYKN